MEYYKIFDLAQEPFSNSPDPEFFYESAQHLHCMQQLELAVRLRRGLNMIVGRVGTGKTTLCRQFILNISADDSIRPYLILDPTFTSTHEFLLVLNKLFGISLVDESQGDWQLKENLKNFLFEQAVDKEFNIVLIIDEGQKIPGTCLEVLRELLNYEANKFKLLQIVIFAQEEISQTLQGMENFEDRINFSLHLKALGFFDTANMVRYRIQQASEERISGSFPLFSWPALWTVYRATGGYPRKIINLCHKIFMAMVIQNSRKASAALVKSCVTAPLSGSDKRSKTALFVFLILALTAGAVFGLNYFKTDHSAEAPTSSPVEQMRSNQTSKTALPALQADPQSVPDSGSLQTDSLPAEPRSKTVRIKPEPTPKLPALDSSQPPTASQPAATAAVPKPDQALHKTESTRPQTKPDPLPFHNSEADSLNTNPLPAKTEIRKENFITASSPKEAAQSKSEPAEATALSSGKGLDINDSTLSREQLQLLFYPGPENSTNTAAMGMGPVIGTVHLPTEIGPVTLIKQVYGTKHTRKIVNFCPLFPSCNPAIKDFTQIPSHAEINFPAFPIQTLTRELYFIRLAQADSLDEIYRMWQKIFKSNLRRKIIIYSLNKTTYNFMIANFRPYRTKKKAVRSILALPDRLIENATVISIPAGSIISTFLHASAG